MFTVKYSIKFLFLVLIIFNIIFSAIFLLKDSLKSPDNRLKQQINQNIFIKDCNNSQQPQVIPQQPITDKISLNFNILDIYRIDISCEYITRDLGSQVSKHYKNFNKKCALASLDRDLDRKLTSISFNNSQILPYTPNFNGTEFNPFATEQNSEFLNELQSGGLWEPVISANKESTCHVDDLEFIVFIVPFSADRLENLRMFILNIHAYLQRAVFKFKYKIVVGEQIGVDKFNKGRLINRMAEYVFDLHKDVDCIVIHDVDLIPTFDPKILKDRGDYRCRQMPWHMSNEVFLMSTSKSRVYNKFLTGGILSLRPEHFINANGFSNNFFGWGAEDDDFTLRMFSHGLCISRDYQSINLNRQHSYEENVAPFTMLMHKPSQVNEARFKVLTNSFWSSQHDGLKNIKQLTSIKEIFLYPTLTHLMIDVGVETI